MSCNTIAWPHGEPLYSERSNDVQGEDSSWKRSRKPQISFTEEFKVSRGDVTIVETIERHGAGDNSTDVGSPLDISKEE